MGQKEETQSKMESLAVTDRNEFMICLMNKIKRGIDANPQDGISEVLKSILPLVEEAVIANGLNWLDQSDFTPETFDPLCDKGRETLAAMVSIDPDAEELGAMNIGRKPVQGFNMFQLVKRAGLDFVGFPTEDLSTTEKESKITEDSEKIPGESWTRTHSSIGSKGKTGKCLAQIEKPGLVTSFIAGLNLGTKNGIQDEIQRISKDISKMEQNMPEGDCPECETTLEILKAMKEVMCRSRLLQ